MTPGGPVERFDRWFCHRVRQTPHAPALTFEEVTYSYAQLWGASSRMAGALAELGATKGSRVAWLGHNSPAVFIGIIAASRLGAAFVPLNRRLATAELARNLSLSGTSVLMADTDHHPVGDQLREACPGLRTVATGEAATDWPSWIDHSPVPADPAADASADEPLIVLFTSGTEGNPKGVVLTHSNIWWQGVAGVLSRAIASTEVVMVMSPLFHVAGLTSMMPSVWQAGGHLVLVRGFEPDLVLDAVSRYGVAFTSGVTTLFEILADHPRFDDADLSSLHSVAVGGAPLTDRLLARFAQHSVSLFQQYGMTEIAVIYSNHGDPDANPLAVGRPYFTNEVCLVTDDGSHTYQPGDAGQVAVRGPAVFWGYLVDGVPCPRPVDAEGYFLTRDLGRLDEQGNLHLVSRLGEMIKTGGEKVYPAEVEKVLVKHPDVAEVVVVPVPHEKWGQMVVAIVVPRPGTAPALAELRRFAEPSLARFKLPTGLRLVPAIPRTASGKLSRRAALEEIERAMPS